MSTSTGSLACIFFSEAKLAVTYVTPRIEKDLPCKYSDSRLLLTTH